jgi:hypothetical protein
MVTKKALVAAMVCSVAGIATLAAMAAPGRSSGVVSAQTRGARSSSSQAQPPGLSGLGALACAGGTSPVKHVIYIQFDNTHLLRDRPEVPSDLEQMPHLLSFMRQNGTLLSNDHTVLISHTGGGILSSITGVYPDRHGQAVSNSFRYYKPGGTTNTGVSFAYWTDGIFDPATSTPTDPSFNMLTPEGKNAPAPWVSYTRAGCDVGMVGTANTVLENIGPDVPNVFGPGSPEAMEVASDPGQAFADFVGIAVHCTATSTRCAPANHGQPDLLPDEPGGYSGFNGLFGAKYVAPQIGAGPIRDLDGAVIKDATNHVGFPGFDGMFPRNSLAYVAAMQEAGIPVTYAYISDAHDNHGVSGEIHVAYGPGEQGYVDQLKEYDRAFGQFFDRLTNDGITKDNTLFVITVEEGDHFAGGQPSNPGCDGVTTACQWQHVTCPTATTPVCPPDNVAEVNVNLRGLLTTQTGNTTGFDVHSDMAPAVYLHGDPARDAAVTRQFEHDLVSVTAQNPYTGQTAPISRELIDRVGMRALHMITGDPLRTPTLVPFLDPDMFAFAGAANCASPCVQEQPGFAWNHGGLVPEVATTWVGFVGPGVRQLGETGQIWSDHTDLRPTMMSLLGLRDDYVHDGRVLVDLLEARAVPQSLRAHRETIERLGQVYKQINAPFGQFGLAAIATSTTAIKGSSTTYASLESQLETLTTDRDTVAASMRDALAAASFDGQSLDEQQAKSLIRQGETLLQRANTLAEVGG